MSRARNLSLRGHRSMASAITEDSITKTHVGLGNVDNTSDATKQTAILSAASASDVGLGNVANESKATMFTSPTFTGTINMHTNPKVRMSEGTDSSDYGHFARRMSWVNSSNMIICQWAIGAHQCGNFDLKFGWTDWCCKSGGGGNCRGTFASGYGAPGSLSEYNMHYDYHTFSLSASGNTIRLLCSGGNGSGPGNVFCGVTTNRSESFSWGS